MNKALIFFALTVGFLINACSSEQPPQNNVVDKIVVNNNTVVNSDSNIQTVQTSNINANGANFAPQVANSQTVNRSSNNPINQNKSRIIESNTGEKPKTTLVPAPHNSAVGTMMGSKGEFIQVRIFNFDKDIQKMENIAGSDKIKVFLKNGKIMEISANKKIDFINSSPQEILIALGLMNPPDASQTGGK